MYRSESMGRAERQCTAVFQWVELSTACRIKETVNGQVFEHLHASATNAKAEANLVPERHHEYLPNRCGFSPRNATGRGELIAAGADIREYVWFEEWADWSGIEKHGDTWHGKLFHSVMDEHIEEEWTFYHPCFDNLPDSFDPAQCKTIRPAVPEDH